MPGLRHRMADLMAVSKNRQDQRAGVGDISAKTQWGNLPGNLEQLIEPICQWAIDWLHPAESFPIVGNDVTPAAEWYSLDYTLCVCPILQGDPGLRRSCKWCIEKVLLAGKLSADQDKFEILMSKCSKRGKQRHILWLQWRLAPIKIVAWRSCVLFLSLKFLSFEICFVLRVSDFGFKWMR